MRKSTRGKVLPFDYPFTDTASASAFETLFTGLQKFNPELTEAVMSDIAIHCIHVLFKPNEIILDYGEICEYVYFAINGLVTSLEKEDGKEFNCWFMSDGDVIIAIDSFFMQHRSRERLVTLANTECIALHVDDLNMLREKHPSFAFLELMLTRYYYQQTFNRTKWLRKDARGKYQMLKAHYPTLIQRVTRVAIASFLGVSREHLNRILREEIAE
ncbi:Crp/Fnr family transcriptional regulator [Chitinophaga caseinilytica]|uniref:Crp/Fnr family transcriptional regulator n=1 Tax=Chitinophaga caseinilytica TaxID=2267521 RepID=UPI003C2E7AAA